MSDLPDKDTLLIFNIQKYSLHDGRGIRTTVFTKGCPLRCRWCCNPESQRGCPELMYRKSRCIGIKKCGLCLKASPDGIVRATKDDRPVIDFEKLSGDLNWCNECPSEALSITGRLVSIDEIIDIVHRDMIFYRHGGGGLTVSGGEPLFQEATPRLLKKAKELRINTAIETCGCVESKALMNAAEFCDEIFFDIKSLDDEKHIRYTGVSNKKIIANLKALKGSFPEKTVHVRTPVIPGFNDSEDELMAIGDFLSELGLTWEKLKYHEYGRGKYEMLGRPYEINADK